MAQVFVGQFLQHVTAVWTTDGKASYAITDVTHLNATIDQRTFTARQVVVEPTHMPFAQVVRSHDPIGAVAPVEHGQITL